MTAQRHILSKTKGTLCPKVRDKLEITKKDSGRWLPTWMGDPAVAMFEVECKPEKFKINLKEESCSCRVWDLTGVPCVHAISAMGWKNQQPEDFVHEYLTKETFSKAYSPLIQPVNGRNLWPNTGQDPVLPPTIKRPPGRPKTKRKKDAVEIEIKMQDPTKMRRRLIPTCSKCKEKGHNMRSCKGPSRGQVSGAASQTASATAAATSAPSGLMAGGTSSPGGPSAGAASQTASATAGTQNASAACQSQAPPKTSRKKTKGSGTNWTPYVGVPPQWNMQNTQQPKASNRPKLPAGMQPTSFTWRGEQGTTTHGFQAASETIKATKGDFVAASQESTRSNNVQLPSSSRND